MSHALAKIVTHLFVQGQRAPGQPPFYGRKVRIPMNPQLALDAGNFGQPFERIPYEAFVRQQRSLSAQRCRKSGFDLIEHW